MKLLSAQEMAALDSRSIAEGGVTGLALMQAAGKSAVAQLQREFGDLFPGPVLILAGQGNNGGDGFVMASDLTRRGWQVRLITLAAADDLRDDAALAHAALPQLTPPAWYCPKGAGLDAALAANGDVRLIVDALLGTGLARPVSVPFATAIRWMNARSAPVVAVDIPSGIDGTSGQVQGVAVQAALTVTFGLVKSGLVTVPGCHHVGKLVTVDIGLPAELMAAAGGGLRWTDAAEARGLCPRRHSAHHKGTGGHLLVVAGSRGKVGAALLTAEAGLRAGAGLVTLACPVSLWDSVAARTLEVMTQGLPEGDGALCVASLPVLQDLVQGKAALALGPGLGRAADTAELVRQLVVQSSVPLVVDADGLHALAAHWDALRDRGERPLVLTPHPGEMARLAGLSTEAVQADRWNIAREFAAAYGVTLVLKGERTLTAAPDGRIWVNASGNPALATAGTGDVLTGLIGGLLAQGMTPAEAAALGVYLHGAAADTLAREMGEAGLLASELLPQIPRERKALQGEERC